MLKQIRNRLISLVFILFGLSILTYGMTYLLPSDPIEVMIDSLGLSHDPETIERLNINNQRIIGEVDRDEWLKDMKDKQGQMSDDVYEPWDD